MSQHEHDEIYRNIFAHAVSNARAAELVLELADLDPDAHRHQGDLDRCHQIAAVLDTEHLTANDKIEIVSFLCQQWKDTADEAVVTKRLLPDKLSRAISVKLWALYMTKAYSGAQTQPH